MITAELALRRIETITDDIVAAEHALGFNVRHPSDGEAIEILDRVLLRLRPREAAE